MKFILIVPRALQYLKRVREQFRHSVERLISAAFTWYSRKAVLRIDVSASQPMLTQTSV